MSFENDCNTHESFESTCSESPLGGTNFLVSAVLLLKKQKKELQNELLRLQMRVRVLESQNAAFMNLSADRLLEKRG